MPASGRLLTLRIDAWTLADVAAAGTVEASSSIEVSFMSDA